MKYSIIALAGAAFLAGCMGPQGNPNGQSYATESGGTIAVAPTPTGPPTYDPNAKAPVSYAMKAGGAGANQPAPSGNPPPPKPVY